MKYKNLIIKLMICICIIIFLTSVVILIKDFIDCKQNNNSIEHLVQEVIEVNQKEVSINWKQLKQINNDIIAWIEIENTNINYPILKDNNLYYLNHTYEKKYNKSGSIFTTNMNPFEEEETVIYGHNMRNGTMFSELGKYLDKNFFEAHNTVKIYTPDIEYIGTVFSAYSIDINEEINNIKNLNYNERLKYYGQANKDINKDIENINKVVKLSTCSYINAKESPTEQRYYIILSIKPLNN